MATAALADIHGNLHALDAVLADPRVAAAERIVVLGDVVAGTFPAETFDRLVALGDRVRILRGNAERIVLEDDGEESRWVRDRLGPERLAAVRAWPMSFAIDVEHLGAVRCCHATPRDDQEIVTRITPEAELAAILEGTDEPIVIGGHTHMQFDRRAGRRRFVNVGSVGRPWEGRPGAYWALARARHRAAPRGVRRGGGGSGRAHVRTAECRPRRGRAAPPADRGRDDRRVRGDAPRAGRPGELDRRFASCEEARRVEQVEKRLSLPEDRLCDKVAAREAEHVAVARVPARDPDAVASRNRADERELVGRRAEDPRPAVRDPRLLARKLRRELLELGLDLGRRLLLGRVLGIQRRVAFPAEHEPPVRKLVPVVVSLPGVMGPSERAVAASGSVTITCPRVGRTTLSTSGRRPLG